jgi:anti-sigma B factor antagonist
MLTAPQLDAAIQDEMTKDPVARAVDLTKVAFIGSAGPNVLVAAHQN